MKTKSHKLAQAVDAYQKNLDSLEAQNACYNEIRLHIRRCFACSWRIKYLQLPTDDLSQMVSLKFLQHVTKGYHVDTVHIEAFFSTIGSRILTDMYRKKKKPKHSAGTIHVAIDTVPHIVHASVASQPDSHILATEIEMSIIDHLKPRERILFMYVVTYGHNDAELLTDLIQHVEFASIKSISSVRVAKHHLRKKIAKLLGLDLRRST
jgi:DNA-directed RNA polymerase specialized sigma24 family protein